MLLESQFLPTLAWQLCCWLCAVSDTDFLTDLDVLVCFLRFGYFTEWYQGFKKRFVYFVCLSVLYGYLFTKRIPGVCIGQKRVSDPQDLELWTIVSCRGGCWETSLGPLQEHKSLNCRAISLPLKVCLLLCFTLYMRMFCMYSCMWLLDSLTLGLHMVVSHVGLWKSNSAPVQEQ